MSWPRQSSVILDFRFKLQLKISHTTRYAFQTPPAYGLQQFRLTPKSNAGQKVLDWSLDVNGAKIQAAYTDEHGNMSHLVALNPNVNELVIASEGLMEMKEQNGVLGPQTGFVPLWLFLRQTALTEIGPQIINLSADIPKNPVVSDFHALSKRIADNVNYKLGSTTATTSAEQAMRLGYGVCQDHAHVFISAARYAGHPARYVSGYLMMNDRIDQDATHAWAEVWIDELGWTGFDVSNGISPDMRYVRIATGLDYSQAAPISGITIGGSGESIDVNVQVQQ